MAVANLSILGRPSRGGLSSIKRRLIFQAIVLVSPVYVNGSQKPLDNGQHANQRPWSREREMSAYQAGISRADVLSLCVPRQALPLGCCCAFLGKQGCKFQVGSFGNNFGAMCVANSLNTRTGLVI